MFDFITEKLQALTSLTRSALESILGKGFVDVVGKYFARIWKLLTALIVSELVIYTLITMAAAGTAVPAWLIAVALLTHIVLYTGIAMTCCDIAHAVFSNASNKAKRAERDAKREESMKEEDLKNNVVADC